MMKTQTPNPVDHTYIRIQIRGALDPTSGQFLPLKFDKTYKDPLIEDPEQHYVAITEASIPFNCVPLIIIYIQEGQSQTDPNLTTFSFCFRYLGSDYFANVIYVPPNTQPTPPPPSQNSGFQQIGSYYFVYNYQILINMLNTTITTAFNAMNAVHSGTLGPQGITAAPYFTYNPVTELFTLNYQAGYNGFTVEFYMNYELSNYLETFKTISYGNNNTNGKDYRFVFSNDVNNEISTGIFGNFQSFQATPRYLNCLNQVLIASNSLQIAGVLQDGRFNTNQSRQAQNVYETEPVILSLDPILEVAKDSSSRLIYNPSKYTLFDINSAGKIDFRRLEFSVLFKDYKGNIFPVCLKNSTAATITFGLFTKPLYKNYPPVSNYSNGSV